MSSTMDMLTDAQIEHIISQERGLDTAKRRAAVELVQSLGYWWDGKRWVARAKTTFNEWQR